MLRITCPAKQNEGVHFWGQLSFAFFRSMQQWKTQEFACKQRQIQWSSAQLKIPVFKDVPFIVSLFTLGQLFSTIAFDTVESSLF